MQAEIWSENLKERNHTENLGVDGRTILKLIEELGRDGVD
jgi:hypothetical protein